MAPQMRRSRQVFFRALPEHTIVFKIVKVSKLTYLKKFFWRTLFSKNVDFSVVGTPKHSFFSKNFQKFWFKRQRALYTRVKIKKS